MISKPRCRIKLCCLLLVLINILVACKNDKSDRTNPESLDRIGILQNEILSLRTEVQILKEDIKGYESKEYDTLLNPYIPYDHSIRGDFSATYRYVSGDTQFLSSSASIISFYSNGRGLIFSALPGDAVGPALFIPSEFRYEKTDQELTICLLNVSTTPISFDDCVVYEYETNFEEETLILTSEKERTLLKIVYSISFP